jgi:hypothetical protein
MLPGTDRHRIGRRRLLVLNPEDHRGSVARRVPDWVPVSHDGSFPVQESNSALSTNAPAMPIAPLRVPLVSVVSGNGSKHDVLAR